MTAEHEPAVELQGRSFDWPGLLNEALEVPGAIGTQYHAFHNYSYMNTLLLFMQGAREPVASYKRWQALGRHVMKGERGLVIVRPIIIKREDGDGNEVKFTRFKPVRGAFTYSQTDGDPLQIPESPEWSADRALEQLDIQRVPFTELNGNSQGYSFERKLALNPVAKWPLKTLTHEMAHIEHGHTEVTTMAEYTQHRGRFEFEAETTALLVTKEVGVSNAQQEAESRSYVQGWLRGERPTDQSIRRVFKVADAIIRAGRVTVEPVEE